MLTQGKAYAPRQGAPPPAPPHPGPLPPASRPTEIVKHLQEVRRHLDETSGQDDDSKRVIGVARRILLMADQKIKAKNYFAADRLIGAADAFIHVAEHASHRVEGPKQPVPPQQDISDHLQHVYFRLQQADFFSRSSGDPDAKDLSVLARKFYDDSRKQYEAGNWFSADEYGKSADDLLRGLENLAQAAMPGPPLPPPPR
jgi:hypothetical protein